MHRSSEGGWSSCISHFELIYEVCNSNLSMTVVLLSQIHKRTPIPTSWADRKVTRCPSSKHTVSREFMSTPCLRSKSTWLIWPAPANARMGDHFFCKKSPIALDDCFSILVLQIRLNTNPYIMLIRHLSHDLPPEPKPSRLLEHSVTWQWVRGPWKGNTHRGYDWEVKSVIVKSRPFFLSHQLMRILEPNSKKSKQLITIEQIRVRPRAA